MLWLVAVTCDANDVVQGEVRHGIRPETQDKKGHTPFLSLLHVRMASDDAPLSGRKRQLSPSTSPSYNIESLPRKTAHTSMLPFDCILPDNGFPIPEWLVQSETGKGEVAFMTLGRYQPSHIGHKVVFDGLVHMAEDYKTRNAGGNARWVSASGAPASNVFVFVTATTNKPQSKCTAADVDTNVKRRKSICGNPLPSHMKAQLLAEQTSMYHDPGVNVVDMGMPRNQINDMGSAVHTLLACYENVKVVVGEDRMAAFGWVVNISKGRVELINAGHRDPLAQGVEGMSATAVRKMVMAGDHDGVRAALQWGGATPELVDTVAREIQKAYTQHTAPTTRKGGRRLTRRGKIDRRTVRRGRKQRSQSRRHGRRQRRSKRRRARHLA